MVRCYDPMASRAPAPGPDLRAQNVQHFSKDPRELYLIIEGTKQNPLILVGKRHLFIFRSKLASCTQLN